MSTNLTVYQDNGQGEIEKIDFVDGEVVDDSSASADSDSGGGFGNFWSFFYGGGFGGNESEPREPYNDNGREYNPASGNWEYTDAANGNASPTQTRQVIIEGYGDSMATDSGL